METLYQINATATASEEFDGETVVIQFRKGTYSVLSGSAPGIFAMLTSPVSLAAICAALSTGGGAQSDGLQSEVEGFVTQLLAAELVVERPADKTAIPDAMTEPYSPPKIETFEDLADLMKIDPVHEVDMELGWPRKPG
jgi:hypothetical protein